MNASCYQHSTVNLTELKAQTKHEKANGCAYIPIASLQMQYCGWNFLSMATKKFNQLRTFLKLLHSLLPLRTCLPCLHKLRLVRYSQFFSSNLILHKLYRLLFSTNFCVCEEIKFISKVQVKIIATQS